MKYLDSNFVLENINLKTEEKPREILKLCNPKDQSLPISGGWGHTLEHCVIINKDDPSVHPDAFNGLEIEYAFVEQRMYAELISGRPMEERFRDIKWTQKEQNLYFESAIAKEFNLEKPNQILFSFFKKNKLIGYGGLVHVDWINQNAEISFLLKTDFNNVGFYTQSFTAFLKLIEKLAFNINMHKIYTYGYRTNEYRFSPLINSFFEKEVELKNHKKINNNWFDVLIYSKLL